MISMLQTIAAGTIAKAVERHRAMTLLDDLATFEAKPLYSYDWRCRTLSAARLRDHLERGEVLHLPDGAAWAIVIPRDNLWLGFGHGEDGALAELLRAIRADASRRPDQELRALVPMAPPLRRALLAAGYVDDGHRELCYELQL